MLVSTAIVAHSTRKAQAFDLAITLDASIAYDLGDHGPGANHRRAWQLANTSAADHVLVIEDDAVLCSNFRDRLAALLDSAPTPIVSLYSGTSYPLHLADQAANAATQAEANGHDWFTLPTLNHAVAVCIRQDHVDSMLDHTNGSPLPIDEAIGAWASDHHTAVSYTAPSLVDHADGPTVIDHPDGLGRTLPRRAIRFAG